jgi:hypothetical protein
MPTADDLDLLTDGALAELASAERQRALRGDRNAFGRAHLLERELRRRAGTISGFGPPLEFAPARAPKRWWQLWARHSGAGGSSVGLRY